MFQCMSGSWQVAHSFYTFSSPPNCDSGKLVASWPLRSGQCWKLELEIEQSVSTCTNMTIKMRLSPCQELYHPASCRRGWGWKGAFPKSWRCSFSVPRIQLQKGRWFFPWAPDVLTFCCFLATDNFCFIFQRLWTKFGQHFQAFSPGSAAPDWPDAKGPSYKDVRRCFTNIGLCRSTELVSIFTVLKMFLDTFFWKVLGQPNDRGQRAVQGRITVFSCFLYFQKLGVHETAQVPEECTCRTWRRSCAWSSNTFFFERFFLKAPLLQTFPRPVAGRRRIKASWENRCPLKCSKICVAALSGDSAARPTGWTTGLHQSGGVVHFVFFSDFKFPIACHLKELKQTAAEVQQQQQVGNRSLCHKWILEILSLPLGAAAERTSESGAPSGSYST